jgi:hypothetical protein
MEGLYITVPPLYMTDVKKCSLTLKYPVLMRIMGKGKQVITTKIRELLGEVCRMLWET